MAVYAGDNAVLFRRAVESVYANSVLPDDFVLVVDGPLSPDLDDVVESLVTQYRIRCHRLSANRGLATALNVGLSLARTEWIARADADDENLPDRFLMQATALKKTGFRLDLLGGAIQEVSRDGTRLGVRRPPTTHTSIKRFALTRNPFNHMTVVYRRRFILQCGGYPQIRLKEDYALWVKVLQSSGMVQNLPDVLVNATAGFDLYRRRSGLRYAWTEYQLQRYSVEQGFKTPLSATLHGLARAAAFLTPSPLKAVLYERHLRSCR